MEIISTNLTDAGWTILFSLWITGAAAAVVIGVLALLMPHLFFKLNEMVNTRVSAWRIDEVMNKPRYIEWLIYRYHFLTGGLLIIIGIGMTYYIIVREQGLPLSFSAFLDDFWSQMLAHLLTGYFCLAALTAFIFGVIILVRPSALKKLESWSNRWVSTQSAFDWLDASHNQLEIWVIANPRLFGCLVLVCIVAVAILVNSFSV